MPKGFDNVQKEVDRMKARFRTGRRGRRGRRGGRRGRRGFHTGMAVSGSALLQGREEKNDINKKEESQPVKEEGRKQLSKTEDVDEKKFEDESFADAFVGKPKEEKKGTDG